MKELAMTFVQKNSAMNPEKKIPVKDTGYGDGYGKIKLCEG